MKRYAPHYTRHVSLQVVCECTHRFGKITGSVNEPKSNDPETNHRAHFPCTFPNDCVREAFHSCWCVYVQDKTWPCVIHFNRCCLTPPVCSPACQDMSFFMYWVIRMPNRSCMVMAFSVVSVIMQLCPFNITSVDSNASVILQKTTPLSTDTSKQKSKLLNSVVNQKRGLKHYGRSIG